MCFLRSLDVLSTQMVVLKAVRKTPVYSLGSVLNTSKYHPRHRNKTTYWRNTDNYPFDVGRQTHTVYPRVIKHGNRHFPGPVIDHVSIHMHIYTRDIPLPWLISGGCGLLSSSDLSTATKHVSIAVRETFTPIAVSAC